VASIALCVGLAACAGTSAPRSGGESPNARAANDNVALAQEYIRNGQYEIAMGRLEQALRLDPRSANAHTMMGLLNERIGRSERAGVSYRRAAQLEPDKGDFANNYGAWLCRNGQPSESLDWFEKALEDPFYRTPDLALSNAGRCARQAGEVGRADALLRRALEANPRNTTVLSELARLQFDQGDFLRARAFIQRRESAGTVDPETLELAARIEERLGDMDAANRYRTRLVNEFPEFRPSTPDS
jgi:type IV pilus assembly protein PilF